MVPDISKIMHGLNFSYAINFNKINKRRDLYFQDRFKSKIVDTQDILLHCLPTFITMC